MFDDTPIAGLRRAESFVDVDEEMSLIATMNDEALTPFRFQRWLGKRLTRSFGWTYDFENGSFREADAIPDWLEPLRARAAQFAGLQPGILVQAMLIRYDPGAGIGWHKDRPVFGHIVGISLGSATTMRFRRRRGEDFDRVSVPLASRSIYHLAGEVRSDWEHSIAPLEELRWSITFRSLRPDK